jgi:hypothetical protein
MEWMSLGDIDYGHMPFDEAWVLFCHDITKKYILHVCGNPPDECKLGTFWLDHDLGSYPRFGLYREYSTWEADRYYLACELAFDKFNSAFDWSAIKPEFDDKNKDEQANDADESELIDDNTSCVDKFAIFLAISVAETFMLHPSSTDHTSQILNGAIKALEVLPNTFSSLQCIFKVELLKNDEEHNQVCYFKFEITESIFRIDKGIKFYEDSNLMDEYSEVCFYMDSEGAHSGDYDLRNIEGAIEHYLNLGAAIIVSDKIDD